MKHFVFNKENTFCINLKHRKDRWERMKRRFHTLDMDVTRWDASTPETVYDKFDALVCGRKIRSCEMACSQSHINIWRHIIQQGLPYAFILEDDASFNIDWKRKLSEFDITKKWHMLILNTIGSSLPYFQWNRCTGKWQTGGYILSYMGAQILLELYNNKFTVADIMTRRLQENGYSYTYFPWLVIQEGTDSDTGNQVELYHSQMMDLLKSIDYPISNYI